ncbi:MAG TPA: tetratricopeptide repeat protein [Pyrinomonadaceae bacterium]|nr:tetratricopeptide repeat protein [Pyrinomonadaceae bacterium]
MLKRLIILVVVLLASLSALPVSGQSTRSTMYRDPASSPHEPSTESKRLYREGVKYALAGLYAQAAQIFQQAVKLDPQFADAHFALGHAYADMGRWQNAIDSFQKALELNPRDLEAQDRLEQARDMLARQTGQKSEKKPEKKEIPKSQPVPQPVAEQISLNAKPVAPATSAPPETSTKETSTSDTSTGETTAATETTDANAAAKELALTKLYRVGPGDVLDVRINDAAAPQSTLFTVTPAGLLEHPLLAEPLHVGGLSVEEISTAIEADIKRRALSETPKVSVGVRDYASHTILVSGLVKDSGTKILRREAIPLYVVVADAQPLPEAARVTVLRSETNETYDIDLGEPAQMNLLVRPGDVISLQPNVEQFLYIGGEVKSPGEKTYRRGLTLTQAIIAAGGVTPKGKEARLGRDDGHGFLTVTRLKLKDIESGKVPDPVVRPGDRIMIVN